MNDDYGLSKLHDNLLIIIKEINYICKKHNLVYFLSDGTALGAIRHEGFIPWDDDLDIVMPRNDYDRFCQLCKTELSEYFFYQNINTDEEYKFTYAKIRLNDSLIQEERFLNKKLHQGIYIDVFPLDNLPNNKCLRTIYKTNYELYRFVLEGLFPHTQPKRTIFKVLMFPLKINLIKEIILKIMRKVILSTKGKNSTFVTHFCGRFDYKRYMFKNEIFAEQLFVNFENLILPVPSLYDEYLSQIFGDYNVLPTYEERIKNQHSIKYIPLNEEKKKEIDEFQNRREKNG